MTNADTIWKRIPRRKNARAAKKSVLLWTIPVIRPIVQENRLIRGLQEKTDAKEGKMSKNYRIKTSCPQCGCSGTTHLSEEELKKRYGDVPNIEMECHECLMAMETDVQEDDRSHKE